MARFKQQNPVARARWPGVVLAALGALAACAAILWPDTASAVPAFNRQTGQNCVACHAGGQFPELTAYGRLFKLTGYTIGQRSLPLSAMAVASMSRVANTAKSEDPSADFAKDGKLILATASLFIAGKVSDNIGVFAQITADPYTQTADGGFVTHSNADNIDIRWADRFIDAQRDLIFGVSLNNNPSVSDPWNTVPAWMQYVPVPSPGSSRFIDGNSPYPGFGAGGNIAGVSAYAFLNRTWYAELGAYRSATGLLSFMSAGIANADTTHLRGLNPYWRLAYNREWGPHTLMLGTSGMASRVYSDPLNTSDAAGVDRYIDLGLDAQYQYLLDPHAVTAQLVYSHGRHRYPADQANQPVSFTEGDALANTNSVDSSQLWRGKLTYVYQAKYGGSLGFFSLGGSTNTANLTVATGSTPDGSSPGQPDGNRSGSPTTRGWTVEAFWTPIQYLRVGAQYTAYSRFNGAAQNYDGFGRNASDNNSLFLYTWLAF